VKGTGVVTSPFENYLDLVEAARLLLDRGADPNSLARNEHIQAGPFHSASASENKDAETRYKLCELLLEDDGVVEL